MSWVRIDVMDPEPCPKCGTQLTYYEDDGDYPDLKIDCPNPDCKYLRYVDGSDA